MPQRSDLTGSLRARLRVPLSLTWAGLLAERLVRAFWPLWSLLIAGFAALMLGVQDIAPFELVAGVAIAAVLGALALLVVGLGRFRWPHRSEALARLDSTLPGRPLQALGDTQAIGLGDTASEALWQAHRARMEQAASGARAAVPDLRIARLDPFGLRYIALLGLVVALLFGSVWRVSSVAQMVPGGGALANGPVWEGWIEPPAYTGLPSLYLADQGRQLQVPVGSRVVLRFYGELGALALAETVSGRIDDLGAATDPAQSFDVMRDGTLAISGSGGRSWAIRALADTPPRVELLSEEAKTAFDGQMSQPFAAHDDYGVVSGTATFRLDIAALERRHGLAAEPEPRAPLVLDLPLPVSGSRAEFVETLVDNLSQHPWAHLPVSLTLEVRDAADQSGASAPVLMKLPARRFFDPLAAALIEQRRDLLWTRENARRVAQVLRAISYQPDDSLFRTKADYLKLRTILRRLEAAITADTLTPETQETLAGALWDLAITLEDGDIADALARMRQARQRLSEAMRNGASDDEIAGLMQELRDATDAYLRQKAQQARRDGADQPDEAERDSVLLSQQDLQAMMDRIEELMRQGRMAEAEEALRQFQEMMENLRMAEGGSGAGGPGQQALEGLAETLREQQGLSDQAFRDLQEQFNPGAGAGQGQGPDGEESAGTGGDLAARQEALRRELERQRGALPGAASDGDALGRAGEAMAEAEEALRADELAEALDRQAEAMEALRDGMRALAEALAEQNSNQQSGQGGARASGAQQGRQSDPLGRLSGQGSRAGTQGDLLQGEDVYRRARELLDELRRRSGESARPEVERNYLERLLERF